MEEIKKKDELLKELSLLTMYLSGWEEDSKLKPGEKIRLSWKGYPYVILNALESEQLIRQVRNAKSVFLSASGVIKAIALKKKYLGE